MDSLRYYIALLIVVTWPAAIPLWFIIHPFISFWRKLGPKLTYAIQFAIMAILGAGLFLFRDTLLSIEFGTSYILIGLSLVAYLLASILYFKRRKLLTTKILMGIPEIAPDKEENKLLTEGIYSRIRHPRYVELLLGLFAFALFTNYLAAYLVFAVSLPAIYLIVLLEEKELRERFGEEYKTYCERVPRFIPEL